MITRDTMIGYLKSRPFRPFKLHMRNGRIFNVRESGDLWVGLSGTLVYESGRKDFGFSDLEAIAEIKFRRTTKSAR